MKYVIVVLLVLIGVWLWRSGRSRDIVNKKPVSKPALQDMVSCAHCGVHLPQTELIQGRDGVYCCTNHRQQAEG